MTKAVSLSLGFILLMATAAALPAQTSSTDMAVNEAVIRQANTIVLRQKLEDAKNAAARGDMVGAAKLYEDSYSLVQQIGSGIDAETAQTVAGLAGTRLTLARQAQGRGDLREAESQISRVLKVDPQNSAALAFKQQNEQMLNKMKGKIADATTLERVPVVRNERIQSGTLIQDGKLLYEMGKLEEAEDKLTQALKLDPDSEAAFYYLNLIKQARYDREDHNHTSDTQTRMVQVARAWEPPINNSLPKPNPYVDLPLPNRAYVTKDDIHTGDGREVIVSKLDRIRIDSVSWPDGLPLNEVIRNLSEQSKLRDPDKKGINFLFNPNSDTSPAEAGGGAAGGGEGAVARDPNTGLPVAPPAGGTGAGESAVDPSTINIKLSLNDVRLADVLDAIVEVADHPIKYSIQDYAIVFSAKGPESPQLSSRTFRVDPNTFYQGLQSVNSFTFGAANFQNSSGGSGGSSGGNSGSGSTVSGAVVPVVDVSPGAGSLRGGQNGGGGGGGGGAGGAGGLNYITTLGSMQDVSVAAQTFFKTLGVDLTTAGKSIFFNDRLGMLFVRGTEQDLDTIENAIQALNQIAPQIHVKARFIEVEQNDSSALGFDWYLGQFGSTVTASGGSEASQGVPVSAANPSGTFPGSTAASQIAGAATDQLLTSGLRNTGPALATVTGILTDPNFRVVLHALEQRTGIENLGEPEVTTLSGRQTQMRATDIITIVSSFNFQGGGTGGTTTTTGTTTTQ
jgi:hypothetical protein